MALLKPQTQPDLRGAAGASDRRNPEQQLLDTDEAVRRRAAQTLVAKPDSVPLLLARLAQEPQVGVRSAILESLLQLQSDRVVEGLLPLLRSEDAAVRNSVIELLQQMPNLVAPHILALLDDSNPDVRIFTVNILESLRHPKVVEWLVGVLEGDPHVNVCATAIDLLGEVGDHRAVAALRTVKQRFPDDPFIQFSADVALGQIE